MPPVIIRDAITSVYSVIAVWIPVTVVPTSFATVAIETFMTDMSRAMMNCPAASVNKTIVAAPARVAVFSVTLRPSLSLSERSPTRTRETLSTCG